MGSDVVKMLIVLLWIICIVYNIDVGIVDICRDYGFIDCFMYIIVVLIVCICVFIGIYYIVWYGYDGKVCRGIIGYY